MTLFRVDGTGVTVPSLEEAQASIRTIFQRLFGDDLALDPQTPQGQLAGAIAVLESLVGELLVGLGNATDPDTVIGLQQDVLYKLLSIQRQEATHSRVTATVTGVAGTGLNVGSRAKTALGAEFRTIDTVTIAPAPGVTVEMESVEAGPVAAIAGTLIQIVTVVPGWETINNDESATLGQARQEDPIYRSTYTIRTGRLSRTYLDSMRAVVTEAGVTKQNNRTTQENRTKADIIIQEWTLWLNSVLFICSGGVASDITRAIENHRATGTPTMTAIRGATPDNAALDSVNNGTITWNGTDYTGLNLSAANTSVQKAAALTAHLAADSIPPTVAFVDGVYVAQFGWMPTVTPTFANATVEEDYGLDVASSIAAPGPFVRPHERALTVAMTVTRSGGVFPSNGLDLLRTAVTNVVDGYNIGQPIWSNDILAAAEGVAGSQVTALSVQYDGVDASGVTPPLDVLWTLPGANLTLIIT